MDLTGRTWLWAEGDADRYGLDKNAPRSRRNREFLGTWTLVLRNMILAYIEGFNEGSHECWKIGLADNVGPPAPNGRSVLNIDFFSYTSADHAKEATEQYLDGLIPPAAFQVEDF